MKSFFKFMCVLCALSAMSVVASAVDEADIYDKSSIYEQGIGKDSYSEALGGLLGEDKTLVSPEVKISADETIEVLSRIHSLYNGTQIPNDYYDYAVQNGIVDEETYNGFSDGIKRYELSKMIADTFPLDYFDCINDVSYIPDVSSQEEFYDDVLMLYNAGVFRGCDEYGNFYAWDDVSRGEFATAIERIALPENRVTYTLKEFGGRYPAAYLIEDENMLRGVRKVTYIASGWQYENPNLLNASGIDYSNNTLGDISNTERVTIKKEIQSVTGGTLGFHSSYIVSGEGSSVYFQDLIGNNVFEILHDDGQFFAIGSEKNSTEYDFLSGTVMLSLFMDVEDKTARVVINGTELGSYDMADFSDISRVCISTSEESTISVTVNNVFLYQNYDVNEDFRMSSVGDSLLGWETDGDVSIIRMTSDSDTLSAEINGYGTAMKSFEAVSDKFVFETYIRTEIGEAACVSLYDGDDNAITVMAMDGLFCFEDGTRLREYTEGVWQQIRIEADTVNNTAVIKINGKHCGTTVFNADSVNSIEIMGDGNSKCHFDDVLLYNVYDYADYCPVPVPVNDDEWYSGMSICSLWREGSHYGWDCISPYEDLTPVLGYYDEGIPEAMDWEIKFMAEHGYDYQRFCWYYGGHSENIKKPRLCDDAIHDGYFNAKYSDMLDFTLMWENAGSKGTKDEFYNNIWPYWMDWYLTDDRYFCIDNKPVITIYSYSSFKGIMGDVAGVKECLDFMEQECINLGYDGIIVYVSEASGRAATNQELAECGFDSKTAYHFDEPAFDIDYQKIRMNAELEAGYIHFTPSCGIGFNDIGWTETRTPLASAEDFEKILRWSRDEYLKYYEQQGITDWRSKSVMTNTWNEYGEGHYVFPTSLNKFGYMDAHRHVFSSVADTDDSGHVDIEPTLNQKSRLGHMYAARNIPLRKLQYDDITSPDSLSFIPVKVWDFENQEDCFMWTELSKTTYPVYDADEKALFGTTTSNDGHIKMFEFDENFFSADDCDYLHVRMKVTTPGASLAEMYFRNSLKSEWVSTRGYNFSILSDGEYHDYYVDLKKLALWQGDIVSIRFDPQNVAGDYYIKKIEFLAVNKDDCLKLNVDGQDLYISPGYFETVDDELYVAGNPTSGFYSENLFYYEWNRWDGKMFIRTKNGTEFEFTVGSNIAVVNGVNTRLSKTIELCDGLVMLPLSFIYDNSGYNYFTDENDVINVEIRAEGIKEIINSRVPYEYEFNINGDQEGWKISSATGGVWDGNLVAVASYNGVRYDPQILLSGLYFDAKLYDSATVRVRPTYSSSGSDTSFAFYFATTADGEMNEAKSFRQLASNYKPDEDGFYTLEYDFTSNDLWTENITGLRFDPPNRAGTYEIDYIRLNVNEAYLEECERLEQAEIDFAQNILKADKGAPFYIVNADAETSDIYKYTGFASDITIVEDDLREGNHAFRIAPAHNNSKVWSYFRIPTRFKTGVTYRVDFEYRLLGDIDEVDRGKTDFAANFVYADVDSNGYVKEAVNHSMAAKPKSVARVSDGWIKCSVTHTVSENSPSRAKDQFTIYTSPLEVDGNVYNQVYLIDNIRVSIPEFLYEFDTAGDMDGWNCYNGTNTSVSNGVLSFDAVYKNNMYDPQIQYNNINLPAETFNAITVRFKPEYKDTSSTNNLSVYFATSENTSLSESKTARVDLNNLTVDDEGFYTATIDLSKNSYWKGNVTTIRIDPPNRPGTYTFDYVFADYK